MAKDKYSTRYVLLESNSLDTILSPLKATQRIKYTCFDVSQNFIIFGATSGGLYIFSRDPCHFLQLLPNKDGSLNNVSISPDEKFIGFSTARGIAAVLERSDEGGAFLISKSEEHGGADITSLTWSDTSNQLYIADNCGQLSVINISLFINKSIFQLPSHVIIKLDSEVFQVSCCGELLLASTRTRSYICDTVKEQYKQIGTKPREGVFGASFIKYPDGVVKAFCARPGSRLWEVDSDGSVLCTHQFKEALTLNPSVAISLPDNKLYKSEFPYWQEQAVNFPYLFPVMDKYLFTFKQDSFYIFDPEKVELIVQCNKYSNVVDARCIADTIYTWNSKGVLKEFMLTPVENCLISLYFRGAYSLCIELCEHFVTYIEALDYSKLIMLSPLLGLSDHIDNLHLNNNLTSFFVNLNNCCNIQSFKINLNDSLESKFKLPKICDKSNSLFSTNGRITQSSRLVISSCFCQFKNVDCVHKVFSDKKKDNIISYLDNNIHHNEFSVDDNLSSYVSNESSPDVSLSFPPQNVYLSLFEAEKRKNGKTKFGTKHFLNKWEVFEEKCNLVKNSERGQLDRESASVNLSDSDESIVVGREIKDKRSPGVSAVDYCSLIEMCDILIKSDDSCKVELFAQLLKRLFVVNVEYKKLITNRNKSQQPKLFPINKYLPQQCIQILTRCFNDIVHSGDLLKCLKLLPEELMKSAMLPCKYPNLLLTLHCSTDLELDIALSNVIFMIVDILDPFNILELIESVNLPCSFMSWYAVVESYQDNTFDYITVPQESYKFNDWPLPVILNIVFLMLRLDQVESACYISKEIRISVKHISYLILRLQLQLEASGVEEKESYTQCHNTFLKYLSSLTEFDIDILKDFCSETVKYIENAIDQVSDIDSCHNCNFPVAKKNTEKKLFNSVGELLFQYYCDGDLLEKAYQTDEEVPCLTEQQTTVTNRIGTFSETSNTRQFNLYKCLRKQMCEKSVKKIMNLVKVMPNVIVNLLESNCCEISDILEFIAQFNLINNVETFSTCLNDDNWIALCENYKEMSDGVCCICHHTVKPSSDEVDWNSLAAAMLRSLGAASSIKILMQYSKFIPPGKICLSFYRTALLSNMLESKPLKDTLFKDIMSTYHSRFIKKPIDSHLSQIGIVSMWEAESSDDSSEGLMPNVVYSKDRKHWGITLDVNFDVCSKCSLVLNSEKLIQDGMRSFKCGHTYHVICLRLCNSLFQCSIC